MAGDTLLIMRALEFAARKHAGQRRKGVAAEPYVNHLAEVALLLAGVAGDEVALVAAGLLHDVVEDTETTPAELEAEFGADVAGLVAEVTDDKSLAKEARKRRQVETAAAKSDRAKMLKLADKTSNLRALVQSPPADWSAARRAAYVGWAGAVAAGLRGVDATLDDALIEARERYGEG